MYIDLTVAVLVLGFAWWSYRQGLLRKLAGITSLVIACLGAGYLGREIAYFADAHWHISMPFMYILCGVLGWIILYVALRVVLGFVARKLGRTEEGKLKGWNKWLGALFGAGEVVLLAWFIVAIFDAIPEDTRARYLPPVHDQLADSWFAWATHATSPAARIELQPLVDDVSAIADEPEVLAKLEQREPFPQLIEHPKVQEILADEKLMDEWRQGRYRRFFSDRRVRDALEDPELRQTLRQVRLRQTLRELADEARQAEE